MVVKRENFFILSIFLGLCFFLFCNIILYTYSLQINNSKITNAKAYDLVASIVEKTSAQDQKEYVYELLLLVGPLRAQDLMYTSGVADTPESHLLAHYVGEFVYKEFGKDGLVYCRDYFLSGCFHMVIINAMNDGGTENIYEFIKKCEEISITQLEKCIHATGHGFVAIYEYDLPQALEMCDSLISHFSYSSDIDIYCYEGVFMENFRGVHGGDISKRWINNDRYYPCNDKRIKTKYLKGCYLNQATVMHTLYKGDWGLVAKGCNDILDENNRKFCANNYARQLFPEVVKSSFEEIKAKCNLLDPDLGDYCFDILLLAGESIGDSSFLDRIKYLDK